MKPIVITSPEQQTVLDELRGYLNNEQLEIIYQGDLQQNDRLDWYVMLIVRGI